LKLQAVQVLWFPWDFSSVVGGDGNGAQGNRATVCGGSDNLAVGILSVVSGGARNSALGAESSISGGQLVRTLSDYSWAAGTLTNP